MPLYLRAPCQFTRTHTNSILCVKGYAGKKMNIFRNSLFYLILSCWDISLWLIFGKQKNNFSTSDRVWICVIYFLSTLIHMTKNDISGEENLYRPFGTLNTTLFLDCVCENSYKTRRYSRSFIGVRPNENNIICLLQYGESHLYQFLGWLKCSSTRKKGTYSEWTIGFNKSRW